MHGELIQDFTVKCPHGCAHQTRGLREAAIAAWNQRATPAEVAALRAEVERLKGALAEIANKRVNWPDRAARAALTAALAVAEGEGAGVFVVPEERRFLSGEGEHVDSANAGAAGHNTCRAAILAGRVTL
jgi:hypothetical protein